MPVLSAPQKALHKLGLKRDIDLALHIPLRYEDETQLTTLLAMRDGDTGQIEATVTASEVQIYGKKQLLVTVHDGSDACVLRFFTFYPAMQKALCVGSRWRVRGELRGGFTGWTMMHPVCKPADQPLPTALTPIYPTGAGLPQNYLRRAVGGALGRCDLSETLPPEALKNSLNRLPSMREALTFLHHPTAQTWVATLEDRSHPAWQRLKAEELLAQQLSQHRAKRERDSLCAPVLQAKPGGLADQLLTSLPFALTQAQTRVVQEIAADLKRQTQVLGDTPLRGIPMNRLLQGDVGAGKTVVAALAAATCIDAGWQCALMVPTEILATQHFTKLVAWLEPLLAPLNKRVAWLTGSLKKKQRTEMLALVASGEAALVVGTHAVIQARVQFHRLALAIIDEQHRFGVQQRLALREKMGQSDNAEPHLLMMTATPIPRTLAMSYYADLDVSTLDELPPGRTPIVTKLVEESRRAEVVGRISRQIAQGRQIYWVCPLIEESEHLDLINATQTHADLCAALPQQLIGLLHSRMTAAEKSAVMALFTAGDMAVLVSTTVIEVGVDVPNASLMVIEHAERFGLSQLHQLRGRVGRGQAASACVLLYSKGEHGRLSQAARERLKAMAETGDGFEIARRDLDIRGPGEFLGARQSGAPLLRFADLATDTDLLDWARATAPLMLSDYPDLAQRHVERWMGSRADYLLA
jgi:ATP-dependent DNA helicase RecG